MKLWLLIGLLTLSVSPYCAISASTAHTQLVSKSKSQLRMWNLQDADIRAVIHLISQLTGKNFIVDPRVRGKITVISSKPMPVDELYQVFLSMLQVLNYAAIPSGGAIKIVPAMQAKEYGGTLKTKKYPGLGDEVVARIVPVNNISAARLVPVLRPLMQSWDSISAYDPSNTLILSGTASNVKRLVSIIHSMDQKNSNTIQVVRLKYANAKKLVSVIETLQTSNRRQGKISNVSLAADEENNKILVSGNAANRFKMATLIKKLDTSNTNGNSNTVVITLKYLNAKKLAPILTKIARGRFAEQQKGKGAASSFGIGGALGSDNGISIQAEEDNNDIIINAPKAMIQNLKHVVRELDIRPKQVLVQAIIVRVDENVVKQLGIQWGTTNPDHGDEEVITATNFPAGIGFIPNGDLRVLIQALLTQSSTDVLATPSVLVLNNRSATISDGKNVGIINRQYEGTGSTVSNDSTLPFNTFERQDVTLQLKVTPHITPDNTVALKIDQQNNSLEADSMSSPDNPTIDTSKIKTSVLVNSGDILVLGGLISNDDKSSENKIPILGDIPILGLLFRYKNHAIEKKNLMVFIRPIILRNQMESRHETRDRYNYMRYQEWLKKVGLPLNTGQPLLPAIDETHLVRLPPPPFSTEEVQLPSPFATERR